MPGRPPGRPISGGRCPRSWKCSRRRAPPGRCNALRELGAGGAGLRTHLPRSDAPIARPLPPLFDGFRTSHEINRVELLDDEDLLALVPEDDILQHRDRRLTPERPVLRGTAQNPDVFFQAREASNSFHDAVPGIVQAMMDRLGDRTGRSYRLVEYEGAPDADRVIVLMGSGVGAASEAVEALEAAGERVGLLKVRLYRPFPAGELVRALPPTVRSIAALDRDKEPGAVGEPLYCDVVTALAEAAAIGEATFTSGPRVIGGRYGLSSKEFTPDTATSRVWIGSSRARATVRTATKSPNTPIS
jgi:pyruvate-ferredoxin/flavodoxin oxidoreductase